MGKHSTVLVVEDDNDIRIALCDILEDEGYVVAHARNGVDAIEQLRRGPRPCLILLDWMMPVMNGAGFLRAQREDSAIADIPVVILSAHLRGGATARELGAADLLPKPFSARDLLDVVGRLC